MHMDSECNPHKIFAYNKETSHPYVLKLLSSGGSVAVQWLVCGTIGKRSEVQILVREDICLDFCLTCAPLANSAVMSAPTRTLSVEDSEDRPPAFISRAQEGEVAN